MRYVPSAFSSIFGSDFFCSCYSLSPYLCPPHPTMSSTAPTKRRISRRSADQPAGLPLQPSKRAREGSTDAGRESEADVSSDEDVYIPSADPAASEMSSASGGELEDDDGDSDAVGAIAAHAKAVAMHNRAGGPAKWDAEAKRARYVEKYGDMTPENALGECSLVFEAYLSLISFTS